MLAANKHDAAPRVPASATSDDEDDGEGDNDDDNDNDKVDEHESRLATHISL